MKSLTKSQKTLLGITEKESIFLDVLIKSGSQNTSSLSMKVKIPRITVRRILMGLHERGLVTRRKKSREIEWKSIDEKKLREKIGEAFGLSPRTNMEPIGLSDMGSLIIYRGEKEMHESNAKLLGMHPGERVLSIEPNGIWRHFARVPLAQWSELNILIKKKQIIFETILEEGFETVIQKEAGAAIEHSFLDIPSDIRVVPARVLDSSTEVLILRDQILFMDWEHQVAIEIKNPSTTRVIKAIFRMLQQSGRSYTPKGK